jgi:hypothetical protein
MKRAATTIGSFFLAATIAACGDSSTPAQRLSTGNYAATIFTTTGTGGQTNQIAAGSELNLSLGPTGATAGHLHIAASGSQPAIEADMAGTWTEEGNVVEIDQPADTFVRDMDFTAGPGVNGTWTLSGDQSFNGTRIQITLTRISGAP